MPSTAYQVSFERPYRGVDNRVHWEAATKIILVGPDSTIEREVEKIQRCHVVDRDRWGERVDHFCPRNFAYSPALQTSGAVTQEARDRLYWEGLQEVPSPGGVHTVSTLHSVSTLRHL